MQAFLNFIKNDWYFAYPMFAMMVVALILVFWRVLLNWNWGTNLNEFLPAFQEKLEKEGVAGALTFCKGRSDIIPKRLFVAGLETSKQGLSAMRRAMANVIELEILPDLNFLLAPILAISKIATMVGLLGTVISMIKTFTKLSELAAAGGGAQGVGGQSESIGLALFATALGLATAIPLVFAHVLCKDWVAKFEVRMKSAAQKFLLLMQSVKPGATPATAQAAAKPAGITTAPAGAK
jgi:biopolymer transport protein ExbB